MPNYKFIAVYGYIILLLFNPALAENMEGIKFVHSKSTGHLIAAINQRPTASRSATSDPVLMSDSFIESLIEEADAYGIANITEELKPIEVFKDNSGITHVKYQQLHQGLIVYGARLTAHISPEGRVLSITGKILEGARRGSSAPGENITLKTSKRIARGVLRRVEPWSSMRKQLRRTRKPNCSTEKGLRRCKKFKRKRRQRALRFNVVSNPQKVIFDQEFLGIDGSGRFTAWRFELSNRAKTSKQEFVIDARTGKLLKRDDGIRGLNRAIRDCSIGNENQCGLNTSQSYVIDGRFINYTHGRLEGDPARGPNPIPVAPFTGSEDVDRVYDMVFHMDDYYMSKFGRDGGNGLGGLGDGVNVDLDFTLVDTHIENGGSASFCGIGGGGFYSGYGITFCTDSVNEDLMGHEYTHRVSEASGLLLQNDAGAIAEAFSDYVGEAFEFQQQGSVDWLIGTGNSVFIRDMADPNGSGIPNLSGGFPYPETYTDPNYYCGTFDSGGIHTNQSILNLLSYYATVGGELNDCTVSGLGFLKMEQVWYQAITAYIAPTQTIGETYTILGQACDDLALLGTAGIVEADCDNLNIAMQAVKMDQDGGCTGQADPAAPATCALVEGDIDIDLDVDSTDYMLWYDSEGQTGPDLAADLNSDLVVDTADCAIWKANFGACNNGSCNELDMFDGDFDVDGDVDSDDYLIWAANYGAAGAGGTAGDGNGDGAVDAADYMLWRNNLGMGSCDTLSPILNADMDVDGDIDHADFQILVAFYGGSGMADLDESGVVDDADCSILKQSYGIGLCPPLGVPGAPCAGTTQELVRGDGNFDGENNLADYVSWRNNYGATDGSGDYNGDGSTDGADYTVWRDNFGAGVCPETVSALSLPGDAHGDSDVDGADLMGESKCWADACD